MSDRGRDALYKLASVLAGVAAVSALGIIGLQVSQLSAKGALILLGFAIPAAMIGLTARSMREDLNRSLRLRRWWR